MRCGAYLATSVPISLLAALVQGVQDKPHFPIESSFLWRDRKRERPCAGLECLSERWGKDISNPDSNEDPCALIHVPYEELA